MVMMNDYKTEFLIISLIYREKPSYPGIVTIYVTLLHHSFTGEKEVSNKNQVLLSHQGHW